MDMGIGALVVVIFSDFSSLPSTSHFFFLLVCRVIYVINREINARRAFMRFSGFPNHLLSSSRHASFPRRTTTGDEIVSQIERQGVAIVAISRI
jgi:hypothetical protein